MPKVTGKEQHEPPLDEVDEKFREMGAECVANCSREVRAHEHRTRVMTKAFLLAHKEILRGVQQLVDEELERAERAHTHTPPTKITVEG